MIRTSFPSQTSNLTTTDCQDRTHVRTAPMFSWICPLWCLRGNKRYSSLGLAKSSIELRATDASYSYGCGTTHQLGLSYLWIDALCIIQDDSDHKRQEIAPMADIYSGAVLTILAANATSIHQGFLQTRSPSAIRKHVFPLRIICANGDEGWLYVYRSEQHSPKREDPLNSRGWTLQEYVLSPRLLIYGSWQARWVCKSMQRWDG